MVMTQTEMMISLNWGKLHETHLFMEMKLVEKWCTSVYLILFRQLVAILSTHRIHKLIGNYGNNQEKQSNDQLQRKQKVSGKGNGF